MDYEGQTCADCRWWKKKDVWGVMGWCMEPTFNLSMKLESFWCRDFTPKNPSNLEKES